MNLSTIRQDLQDIKFLVEHTLQNLDILMRTQTYKLDNGVELVIGDRIRNPFDGRIGTFVSYGRRDCNSIYNFDIDYDNGQKVAHPPWMEMEKTKTTKQVIVIRRDLKMRRGKECSMAAHASIKFLTD